MQVAIRWMIRADFADVLAIEAKSFDNPWDEAEFIRALRDRHTLGMVAEANDGERERVVGFYVYELHKDRIEVLNFAVHPDFRRLGVGTQIAEHCLRKIEPKDGGYRRKRIGLCIRESNLPAQLFFKALGFRCIAMHGEWYDDSDEAAYRFVKWREAAQPILTAVEAAAGR